MTTPPEPTCETCRYYQENESDAQWGHCRRYPPKKTPPNGISEFSEVGEDVWCGEHSPRIPLPVVPVEHVEGEYINAHLITEAVAKERERCAMVAEGVRSDYAAESVGSSSATLLQGMADGANVVAARIRSSKP